MSRRPARRVRGSAAGFALLDALAALVVATLAVAAVAHTAARWQAAWSEAQQWREAEGLAAEAVETVRAEAGRHDADAPWRDRPGRVALEGAEGRRYTRTETLTPAGPLLHHQVVLQGDDLDLGVGATPRDPVWQVVQLRLDPRDTAETLRRAEPPASPRAAYRRTPGLPLDARASLRLDGRDTARLGWAGSWLLFTASDARVRWRCASDPAASDPSQGLPPDCQPYAAVLLQGWLHAPADWIDRLQPAVRADTPGAEAPHCVVDRPADGSDLPTTDEHGTSVRRYRCLLPWPLDAAVAGWSGQLRWQDRPAATLHCAAASGQGTGIAGSYTGIASSLDHQNHWLLAGGTCPAGSVVVDD